MKAVTMLKIGSNPVLRYALYAVRNAQTTRAMAWVTRRKTQSAFTLIEIMVATVVLSLGAVLVHRSFFTCLDSVNYYSDYLSVIPWMDEKVWQAQDALSRSESPQLAGKNGEFKSRNKVFSWNLGYGFVDEESRLYRINLVVFWQEGSRKVKLLRTAYAMYEDKK